jgi:tetratricopeptide (TPR) repeat protein
MRCSRARKLISEYVDGGLRAQKSALLERHLEVCGDCKHVLEDFKIIAEDAKKLEELLPSDQTWLKIKAGLKPEEQRVLAFKPQKRAWFSLVFSPPRLKYALSSVVILAILVGAVILGLRHWIGPNFQGRGDLQKYTLAKLNEAERHYQKAIKALEEAVSAQEGKLDPQIAQVFKTNLRVIDSSLSACRQMVVQNPEDLNARNYLLEAYREKLNFLNEIIEVEQSASQRRELKTTI